MKLKKATPFIMNGSNATGSDELGYWFKCKGCNGGLIGFFPRGMPPEYAGETCAHTKPASKVNIPNSVPCDLFKRTTTRQLKEIHRDAEPVLDVTQLEPIRD